MRSRAVIKSQPPPRICSHQPPVAPLPHTIMLTCLATRLPVVLAQAAETRCVCVCVKKFTQVCVP